MAVVSHRLVKLIIGPCGIGIAQESLIFGKPLLCIPLIAEQLQAAYRIVDRGAGLMVDKSRFDSLEIRQKVNWLLTNARFKVILLLL